MAYGNNGNVVIKWRMHNSLKLPYSAFAEPRLRAHQQTIEWGNRQKLKNTKISKLILVHRVVLCWEEAQLLFTLSINAGLTRAAVAVVAAADAEEDEDDEDGDALTTARECERALQII